MNGTNTRSDCVGQLHSFRSVCLTCCSGIAAGCRRWSFSKRFRAQSWAEQDASSISQAIFLRIKFIFFKFYLWRLSMHACHVVRVPQLQSGQQPAHYFPALSGWHCGIGLLAEHSGLRRPRHSVASQLQVTPWCLGPKKSVHFFRRPASARSDITCQN